MQPTVLKKTFRDERESEWAVFFSVARPGSPRVRHEQKISALCWCLHPYCPIQPNVPIGIRQPVVGVTPFPSWPSGQLLLQNDTFSGNLNWKNQTNCPLRQRGGGGSIDATCSMLFPATRLMSCALVLRPSALAGTYAFLQLIGKHTQKVALNSTVAFIWHLALS